MKEPRCIGIGISEALGPSGVLLLHPGVFGVSGLSLIRAGAL